MGVVKASQMGRLEMEKFLGDLDNPWEDGLRSVKVTDASVLDQDNVLLPMPEAVVSGTKVLMCTGSKSHRFPGIPFDQIHHAFDSNTINLLGYLPRSVANSGLGIIRIEFANIFNTLGLGVKDVTILVQRDIKASTWK